jgi:hypothetical protein
LVVVVLGNDHMVGYVSPKGGKEKKKNQNGITVRSEWEARMTRVVCTVR